MFRGCARCLEDDVASNLMVVYDDMALSQAARHQRETAHRDGTMWDYRRLLPVHDENIVTLGEGGTPLLHVERLGRRLGIPNLFVKDESRNPTGSFKDRLASAAVSMARQMGAKVVVGSSSGNAGAATAAFAARAGLPCVLFTEKHFPVAMRTQMGALGAYLLAAPSIQDRWSLVEDAVNQFGWFPVTVFGNPIVGSNCYGIEGYKTIGYEITDQLGAVPDDVIAPVGAGDAFTGIWKALTEYKAAGVIDRMPRMHAAELFGSLQQALANGLESPQEVPMGSEPTVAVSVSSNRGTYQALHVLRETGGAARSPTNKDILRAQADLARYEGLYVEPSAAVGLAVLPEMVGEELIDPEATIVAVLTSTGLKDPEVTARTLPPIPACGTRIDEALAALRDAYGFVDVLRPQDAIGDDPMRDET